jgi:hypothetical protein
LAQDFLKAADSHGLDWRLLPSISLVETGAGRDAKNNNIFGWDSGRKAYSSVRQAIYHVASRLASSKLYENKNLDQLLATYNPVPQYADRVKSVMSQFNSLEPLRARCVTRGSVSPSAGLLRTARLEPAQ